MLVIRGAYNGGGLYSGDLYSGFYVLDLVGWFAYTCRFRSGCGWMLASLVIYGQVFANLGSFGLVRLIERGLDRYLVGGSRYVCSSRGGCEWVLARMG